MSNKLEGKVAVITGGSSGIGLATAKKFVAEGACVFIISRRSTALAEAKTAIGTNVTCVQGDVNNPDDLDRFFEIIEQKRGLIDIVVTNAATLERTPLNTTTTTSFDMLFNTNARSVFFTVQKALPLMARGGSIVLIASSMHLKGVPEYSIYTATKAVVRSFARTWAMELKERGIRVNTLSPGATETPMFRNQSSSPEEANVSRASVCATTPLARLACPEEIAQAALFLASDDSSYSTGIDLVVDGGISQV